MQRADLYRPSESAEDMPNIRCTIVPWNPLFSLSKLYRDSLTPTRLGAVRREKEEDMKNVTRTHYTADQCQTGGYECDHRHRTFDTAEACRTKGYGQLARVHKYINGHEIDCANDAQQFFDDQDT